ncbi:MAG TPA: cysteine hydrolase [Chloroflexota bacterium]|nr:cysteine hydrolase [Chloroflexota bacterium]
MPHVDIVPDRCALVINDMEQRMVQPGTPFFAPDAEKAVGLLMPLLQHCRERGIPTVFALIGDENIREKTIIRQELAPDAEIDPSLCRKADAFGDHPNDFVFVKRWMSGCISDTPLVDYVRQRSRDTLLVAGTTLQFGCDTTIREAANLGFKVVALHDCCAARPIVDQGWGTVSEEEVRKAFFSTWSKAFARVITAAEALAELQFKA